MNTPIGIPSGWEERAAVAACGAGFGFMATRTVYATDIMYSGVRVADLKRDWREEPSQ